MKITDPLYKQFLQANRAKLFELMPVNSIAIVYAANEQVRANDMHYRFSQNRNYLWLTGLEEPDGIAVFVKDSTGMQQFILFTLPLDPRLEQFSAPRIGKEKAVSEYDATSAYELAEFNSIIKPLLNGKAMGYFATNNEKLESIRSKIFAEMLENRQRPPHALQDIEHILGQFRLIKADFEIALIRKATYISMFGHLRAMLKTRPGLNESDIQRTIENAFKKYGCKEQSYDTIVAGGPNSWYLHYSVNNAPLKAGELLLVDAAAELDNMASDITSTFPISDTFSEPQKAIYNLVLNTNLAVVAAAKIGAPFTILQDTTIRLLTAGALELGLLSGDLEELIQQKAIRRFYPHGCSHWLGWEAHDVSAYVDAAGEAIKLQPGMVFTVEPGLYIPQNATDLDAKWRGIGVRIEDIILMQAYGPENLCAMLPRSVEDIEQFIARNRNKTPKVVKPISLKSACDSLEFLRPTENSGALSPMSKVKQACVKK